MAVADKIRDSLSRSSWIRKMFEEGDRLRQLHGPDQVYDFTLGNPDLDPPECVTNACGLSRRIPCRGCTST